MTPGPSMRSEIPKRAHRREALLGLLLLLGALGCSDRHARPVCPGGDGRCPTLADLWPSADSTAWTYHYSEAGWGTPGTPAYPTPEAVPPAPSVDSAARLLDRMHAEHPADEVDAIYRLQFLGRHTTQSGAEGQHLVEGFYHDKSAEAIPRPRDPFLRRLAEVRPDLRARIAALTSDQSPTQSTGTMGRPEFAPLFLHGSAWVRLDHLIGGYGDLDTEIAWVYLTSELAPGSGFTHQLVPALDDDVFLHGLVLGYRDVRTEAGLFRNCLECVYLVDFGPFQVFNEQGTVIGYARGFDCGNILYAPGIGPVQSREYRSFEGPEFGEGGTIRLDLIGRTTPGGARSVGGRTASMSNRPS